MVGNITRQLKFALLTKELEMRTATFFWKSYLCCEYLFFIGAYTFRLPLLYFEVSEFGGLCVNMQLILL